MIFSVIVPFLNEERYIGRCIESLINQDFDKSEYELIFIDNGSQDKSAQIVRNFPQVRMLKEDRRNPYYARNKGIEVARGRIIAFTDADCTVCSDWLSQIYRSMKESNVPVVLGKRILSEKPRFLLRMAQDYENAKVEYFTDRNLKPYLFGYTNNMAVEADLFRQLGFFFTEVSFSGDTEFVIRYFKKNPDARIIYLENMKINHLEVFNIKVWLSKKKLRGEYNIILDENFIFSKVDIYTRLKIYCQYAVRKRYGIIKKIIAFILLLVGLMHYDLGKFKGFIKYKLCRKKFY